ncbi:MAG: hypothetical protein MUO21_08620, partial [Nitrososphaeraceae archaeon]|nr:hypothetical protein [Nitrososphaeraceae archaeon]
LSLGISFLIMTSILPAEQVKEIFIDFRNTEANMIKDNTNNNTNIPSTTTTITENKELIENKFLYSIHIIFFVSSIIVFISIIPATIKDRNIRR